jgi:aryl-alcohol dehydrogenase-like predicted oxidoreductase
MIYNKIGSSDLKVSRICLGTMTWGEQNTQEEAFEQMDYAIEQGINFFDTAELYPVPPTEPTYTRTETIIGNWFKTRGSRDKVILASKVIGRSPGLHWIRGENNCLDEANIEEALAGSLKRLQTDYLDLYQFHWPDRNANFFGKLGFRYSKDEYWDKIEASLEAASKLVRAGKVRYLGISNETAWGMMKFLEIAKSKGLEKIISIQNPYSLVNRSFEVGCAEVCHREQVGLLAYSPLAFGVLSGKYDNGARPEKARLTLYSNHFSRYLAGQTLKAAEAYNALARDQGLSPAQMALAFVNQRSFLAANIVGATQMDQLKENIETINIHLSDDLLKKIEDIHDIYTYPAP